MDIINQTDQVDQVDGEEKLGQPMINLSLVRDWGIVDLFVLPGFRERTYAGEEGRPRTPLPVSDDAVYESPRRRAGWTLPFDTSSTSITDRVCPVAFFRHQPRSLVDSPEPDHGGAAGVTGHRAIACRQ